MEKRMILCLLFGLLWLADLSANDRLDYIARYKDIAIREMERAGIPASIKLAQALLESDAGNSYLARKANNHFGIKCGAAWDGKKFYRLDDDYDDKGNRVKSCFRAYKDAEDSFIAHSEFLRDPAKEYRYGFLFRIDPTDYKRWATGLKKAGYATSATYDQKLIRIIEQYELHQYDLMSGDDLLWPEDRKEEEESPEIAMGIVRLNDVKLILAAEGDTPRKIADRTGVSVSKILRYNEQLGSETAELPDGSRVYLQCKRNFFRGNKTWHYVKEGETMYDISQMYGIKLDKLYWRNMMPMGSEPAVGERVRLRKRTRNESERPKLREEVKPVPEEEKEELDLDDITWPPEEDLFEEEDPFEEPPVKQPENPKPPVVKPDTTGTPPPPKPQDPQPEPEPKIEIYHLVQKGDTLYSLSKRYDTTVEAIKTLNGLSDNLISVGQKLRVQ